MDQWKRPFSCDVIFRTVQREAREALAPLRSVSNASEDRLDKIILPVSAFKRVQRGLNDAVERGPVSSQLKALIFHGLTILRGSYKEDKLVE